MPKLVAGVAADPEIARKLGNFSVSAAPPRPVILDPGTVLLLARKTELSFRLADEQRFLLESASTFALQVAATLSEVRRYFSDVWSNEFD